mmetsp:Transcript_21690/g.54603  ORF Transcript_21690/g.54603 Transcript_21690/m.54603 type:complete len:203 (+) Transcript_21690:215-823(+)
MPPCDRQREGANPRTGLRLPPPSLLLLLLLLRSCAAAADHLPCPPPPPPPPVPGSGASWPPQPQPGDPRRPLPRSSSAKCRRAGASPFPSITSAGRRPMTSRRSRSCTLPATRSSWRPTTRSTPWRRRCPPWRPRGPSCWPAARSTSRSRTAAGGGWSGRGAGAPCSPTSQQAEGRSSRDWGTCATLRPARASPAGASPRRC